MRCRSHKQKMSSDSAKQFSQFITLRFVNFITEPVSGKFMSFINNNQIPMRCLQFLLQILCASQLIHSRNQQIFIVEIISGR